MSGVCLSRAAGEMHALEVPCTRDPGTVAWACQPFTLSTWRKWCTTSIRSDWAAMTAEMSL